jgi:cytochrome c peroxidase
MRFVLRMIWVLAVAACGNRAAPVDHELTAAERAELAKLSPLPPLPVDTPQEVALGQMLFFDDELAGTGNAVSCHTCHDGPALDDTPNHVSLGAKHGPRNSPPIVNSAYYKWSNWGGRFDSQWSLVLGASENPEVMNGTRLAIVRRVADKYRAEYDAVFPPLEVAVLARLPATGKPKPAGGPDGAWEAMAAADRELVDRIFVNVGKAIAAYMRTLVARDAPFDRYAAGDRKAISPEAKRGFKLFLAHCKSCHGGPHFQDDQFHALGVAQFGEHVPAVDLGRFTDVVPLLASKFATPDRLVGLAQSPAQRGQFRTPTLRNVAVTAPYMHAGQFATLEAVVKFYNAGGGREEAGVTKSPLIKKLELTDAQQADLVAFMTTLTDTKLPPERLVDTSR